MTYKILDFPHFTDTKGTLTPFELGDDFPFTVQRVYTVTGRPGVTRGAHAHQIESEVFVVVNGSVTALVDDGKRSEKVQLDAPNKGLFVPRMCWHEFFNFSPEAVLLCFSSTPYQPGVHNYITDKATFYQQLKAQ